MLVVLASVVLELHGIARSAPWLGTKPVGTREGGARVGCLYAYGLYSRSGRMAFTLEAWFLDDCR